MNSSKLACDTLQCQRVPYNEKKAMHVTRKYLIYSLLFHLGIILLISIMSLFKQNENKTFVVLGAHSKKPSHVAYKSNKLARSSVPFVGGSKRGGRGQKAGRKGGKTTAKKQTIPVKSKKVAPKKAPSKPKASAKKSIVQPVSTVDEDVIADLDSPKKNTKKLIKKALKQSAYRAKQKKQAQDPEGPAPKTLDKQLLAKNDPEEFPDSKDKPEQAEEQSHNSDDLDIQDDSGFSLVGHEDAEKIHIYQKHVQNEVERLWRPPVGVPRGTISSVYFSVADDGSIDTFKFLKRSQVLIYDLSIMRVAKNFTFDKCLWGKQFKIDFRQ